MRAAITRTARNWARTALKPCSAFTTASSDNRSDTIQTLEKLVGQSERGRSGVDELIQIDSILNAVGFGNDRVSYDTSIVRGLGYYTGPVFEAELLTEIKDRKGRPVRIGSVGGGGRYDDLVSRFRGQAVPATGFSFGVSRFLTALERMDALEAEVKPPVVICAFDRGLMGEYFKLAGELHAQGIRAEVFVGSGNVTKQMKYADRRNAQVAVLMGSDEMEAGQITLKDLYTKARKRLLPLSLMKNGNPPARHRKLWRAGSGWRLLRRCWRVKVEA